MGGNLSEKTSCWIDPRTEAATPKVFPDPSHGEGGVMTSPGVNINTLYLGQNHVFLFNLIPKGTYLQSGHKRRPGDVTPLSLIHEDNKRCLPFG